MLHSAAAERLTVSYDPQDVGQMLMRICDQYGRACARIDRQQTGRRRGIERRTCDRVAIDIPFYLHEVDQVGNQIQHRGTQPLIAVTRDLSIRGVGFQYDTPFASRFVLAEFDVAGAGPQRLLLDIRWHQKKSSHFYVGGALAIGIVVDEP